MQRTVLLRHETDEGVHFDWLLERPDGDLLLTFRLDERIDEPALRTWKGLKIRDHRPKYLDYEGEIAGRRGRVIRLASGACRITREQPDSFRAVIHIGELHGQVRGVRENGDMWAFRVEERR